MIDVETDVFNYVHPAVVNLVPAGCFKSEYVPNPSKFPFATLIEMDNVTDASMRGSGDTEEYAILTYETNVYAMNKHQCRTVADALDRKLAELGFTRISMGFIPNLADSQVFRLTGRYRAEADNNKVIYRHT